MVRIEPRQLDSVSNSPPLKQIRQRLLTVRELRIVFPAAAYQKRELCTGVKNYVDRLPF